MDTGNVCILIGVGGYRQCVYLIGVGGYRQCVYLIGVGGYRQCVYLIGVDITSVYILTCVDVTNVVLPSDSHRASKTLVSDYLVVPIVFTFTCFVLNIVVCLSDSCNKLKKKEYYSIAYQLLYL